MSQQVELACRAADRGEFDSAFALADQVPPDRLEFAACRSLIASVYRQVGRHQRAETYDAEGLAAALPDALGRAMCALGSAADRVGVADQAEARTRLAAAEVCLRDVPPDHWAVRWFDPWLTHAWVGAEVALLDDDPARAVVLLEPFAVVRPRAAPNTRWPFERAKTWLFLGVSQRCDGQSDAAVESLTRSVRIAADAGLWPLLVPACAQLRELDPAGAAPWLPMAKRASARLSRHLPPT